MKEKVLLLFWSKGQRKSKLFFQAKVSSKKATNEFNFTTKGEIRPKAGLARRRFSQKMNERI